MKKLFASFKKYPRSWMFFAAALACGAGWVSGNIAIAVISLLLFVALVRYLGKYGAQDPE